jgi:PAS domain S-box-containing protein
VHQDITDRKKAENALRQVEDKYRSIFENAIVGIFQTTPEGRYLSVNPALARMFGYDSPEDMMSSVVDIGRQLYVNPEQQKEHLRLLNEKGVNENYEEQMYRKNGSIVWVFINTWAVRDDAGNPLYYEGFVTDITERKQVEEALQKTREMLVQSEKLAALGQLSSGAAHEILNPLNVISLRLQFLEMTENLSEKTKETIKVAKAQIDRIVKITHSISEFSRTAALHMTTVDLRELMEDVLLLTAPRLKEENVTFDFQYQADIPLLSLDKFRIEQVILNLINNAIDAMKDRKEKILRVAAALESSKGERNVWVTFADNGTGIKAEDMSRIFEPFFTTKEPDKGRGLGLSVCYGIIQDHHGRIWAKNNKSGGATFFIELPLGERVFLDKIEPA